MNITRIKDIVKKNRLNISIIFVILFVLFLHFFVIKLALNFVVIALLVLMMILKKQKEFVKDWSIPLILLYIYEFLRGCGDLIAQSLNRPLVNDVLVNIETKFFGINGEIPNVVLQYALSDPLSSIFIPHWYDFFFFFFYMSFFMFWLGIGFILWFKAKKMFKQYIYGLAGFSLLDCVIYILYPSAPPWYASQVGLLPVLKRTMYSFDFLASKSTELISTYGNNDFAAWPSHHAAWSFFAALFLVRLYGKRALPVFIVPIMVILSTWYGAEHYVIDSLGGCLIAYITYLIVTGDYKKVGNIFKKKG